MQKKKPYREPTAAELNVDQQQLLEEHDAIRRLNQSQQQQQQEEEGENTKPVDEKIIGSYLKESLGKSLLGKLSNGKYKVRSFYPSCSKPAYEYGHTETSLSFTFRLDGTTVIPPEGLFVPFKQATKFLGNWHDGKRVTFVSACCRHYVNRSEQPLCAAFDVAVTHKAFQGVKDALTDIAEDLGGLKGASVFFEPQKEQRKDQYFLHVQHVNGVRFHFSNPDFIKQTYCVSGNADYGAYMNKPADECTQLEIAAYKSGVLNNTNQALWNGITRIPADVCRKAHLPLYDEQKALEAHLKTKELVYKNGLTRPGVDDDDDDGGIAMMDISDDGAQQQITEEERKQSKFLNVDDDKKIRCWYHMDPDHLLTWPLTTALDQRKSAGIYAIRLHVAPPSFAPSGAEGSSNNFAPPKGGPGGAKSKFLCGYLMPDAVLRGMIRSYESCWQDRIDFRDDALNTTGFVIAPSNREQGALSGVELEFTVHCQCIFWEPPPSNWSGIAPKLHPAFPAFSNFVRTPFDDVLGQRMEALSLNDASTDK